jgi:hypothetical protein
VTRENEAISPTTALICCAALRRSADRRRLAGWIVRRCWRWCWPTTRRPRCWWACHPAVAAVAAAAAHPRPMSRGGLTPPRRRPSTRPLLRRQRRVSGVAVVGGVWGGVLRRRWCSVPRPTSVDKPAASVLAAVWTASCLCNVCSRPELLSPPRCMPLGGPAGSQQQQQPGGSEGRTRRRSLTEVAVRTVQGLGPAAPLDNGALHRHAPPLNSIPAPSHHCDCAVCLLVVAAAAVWLLIGPHHGVSQAISPPDPWTNAVRRVPLLLRAPKPACLRTQHACCHVCAPRDGMPWIAEPPRCVTPAYLSSP